MARIGVQAMMLKNEFEADGAFTTLKRLSELGFNAVEISQIPMSEANVGEIERARVEFGMETAALSAALETPVGMPGDSLTNDFDKIVADCKRLACQIVRMGMMPFSAMASQQALLDFCSRSNELAARLAEQGIALYYHNHHVEFMRADGEQLREITRLVESGAIKPLVDKVFPLERVREALEKIIGAHDSDDASGGEMYYAEVVYPVVEAARAALKD